MYNWAFIEHVSKIIKSNIRHIPITNILVKGIISTEHTFHSSDLRHIPITNILVEFNCILHSFHSSDIRNISFGNIIIKGSTSFE